MAATLHPEQNEFDAVAWFNELLAALNDKARLRELLEQAYMLGVNSTEAGMGIFDIHQFQNAVCAQIQTHLKTQNVTDTLMLQMAQLRVQAKRCEQEYEDENENHENPNHQEHNYSVITDQLRSLVTTKYLSQKNVQENGPEYNRRFNAELDRFELKAKKLSLVSRDVDHGPQYNEQFNAPLDQLELKADKVTPKTKTLSLVNDDVDHRKANKLLSGLLKGGFWANLFRSRQSKDLTVKQALYIYLNIPSTQRAELKNPFRERTGLFSGFGRNYHRELMKELKEKPESYSKEELMSIRDMSGINDYEQLNTLTTEIINKINTAFIDAADARARKNIGGGSNQATAKMLGNTEPVAPQADDIQKNDKLAKILSASWRENKFATSKRGYKCPTSPVRDGGRDGRFHTMSPSGFRNG